MLTGDIIEDLVRDFVKALLVFVNSTLSELSANEFAVDTMIRGIHIE